MRQEFASRNADLDLGEWIDGLRHELAQADAKLVEMQQQLAEAAQRDLEIGPAWWRSQQSAIGAARRQGRFIEATAWWLTAWAEALAADEPDLALEIGQADAAKPDPELAQAARAIAEALKAPPTVDEMLDEVLPRVELLWREPSLLTVESGWALGTLRTRIWLEAGDLAAAEAAADDLDRLLDTDGLATPPPDSPVRAGGDTGRRALGRERARIIRAEVDLAAGRLDQAREHLAEALWVPAPVPDAHVVAAMLAEQERLWERVDAHCDAALDDEGGFSTALLAPIPARLRIRAARRLSDSQPQAALNQLDLAVEVEIHGAGPDPEIEVHLDRARLLRRLKEPVAASEALVEAANRLEWSDQTDRALEVYQEAIELPGAAAPAWWWYAEALRLAATREDEVVDRPQMERASEVMAEGLRRGEPGPDDGWVLVTRALILDALDPADDEPLELAERALLLDENYATAYGFLARLLKRRGHLHHALAAAHQGWQAEPGQMLIRDTYCELLQDHAEYEEAMRLVDAELIRAPDDQEMLASRASIEERTRQRNTAIATAEGLALGSDRQLLLGTYRSAVGDWRGAREAFAPLLPGKRPDENAGYAGWAAYRTGRVAEAISIYRPLADKASADLNYTRDLGQMLLVRGAAEDEPVEGEQLLSEGERLLRAGIAAATSPDGLRELASIEFAMIRHDVEGSPHRARVDSVLIECADLIEARITDLMSNPPLPDERWAGLCRARESLASTDATDAVQLYAELVDAEPSAADLRAALLRAAVALFGQSDNSLSSQRLEDARAGWAVLDRAVPRIDGGEVLDAALAARRAVSTLADSTADTEPVIVVLRIPELGDRVLADAIELFSGDPARLWAIYDALRRLAADERAQLSPDERSTLDRLAADLPLAQAYRLDPDYERQVAAKRLVSAVEIRMSYAHRRLGPDLKARIRQLRTVLAAEMGVEIPGVRRRFDRLDASDRVDYLIYQQLVDTESVDPESADPVATIIETLSRVLRAHLYRLLGPDDVRLWLAGWRPTSQAPAAWAPADPPRARLRLVRVLRMLLREGVPVSQVDLIVSAVTRAEGAGGGPVAALRAVRAGLGPIALGAPPSRPRYRLPTELETRLVAGVRPEPDQHWEMPRAATAILLRDLRTWLTSLSGRAVGYPVVVVLSDPVARLYAWRLLAGSGVPVRVLAEEELR